MNKPPCGWNSLGLWNPLHILWINSVFVPVCHVCDEQTQITSSCRSLIHASTEMFALIKITRVESARKLSLPVEVEDPWTIKRLLVAPFWLVGTARSEKGEGKSRKKSSEGNDKLCTLNCVTVVVWHVTAFTTPFPGYFSSLVAYRPQGMHFSLPHLFNVQACITCVFIPDS